MLTSGLTCKYIIAKKEKREKRKERKKACTRIEVLNNYFDSCLTLLGYIPGHVHAFYVLIKEREAKAAGQQTISQGQTYGAVPPS